MVEPGCSHRLARLHRNFIKSQAAGEFFERHPNQIVIADADASRQQHQVSLISSLLQCRIDRRSLVWELGDPHHFGAGQLPGKTKVSSVALKDLAWATQGPGALQFIAGRKDHQARSLPASDLGEPEAG